MNPHARKPKTLADFTLPQMILICGQCGGRGRYNVAHLIEKHGGDMPIRDFIDVIGRSCDRWANPTKHQSFGLGCDALIYMFMPKPAADGYAEKIQKREQTG
ncbi:hypothetical protein SAMCCGM7_pC0816 (plasmid) [Sinorhizobium americanum CCGM7]|uniref:hypothetical protein n=1 Tax=Sinorhizobium americanum TaxID=194963 RepID=UPI0004D8E7AF|nr:hypothetical protein [Sinorhizobium americanum]APG88014.1 hypothetical protein SAMCCGM7_pC0816 [Sinorhizobium americanum CCGM7]